MKQLPLLILIAALCGCVSIPHTNDWNSETIPELKSNIESKLPGAYYILAVKMFERDPASKEEAVVWFYAGQLRYRYYLAANPGLDPSGDPALFASLSEVVGRPINEYAGGDPDLWIRSIDKALAWDKAHENSFTPKTKTPVKYKRIRSGLVKLRNYIDRNRDQIKKQRKRSGLD